jgi:integrase
VEAGRIPQAAAAAFFQYSAGLRVSRALYLRPEDLDPDRGTIRVRRGKSRKDRTTLLSLTAMAAGATYCAAYPPDRCLFPGAPPGPAPLKPVHPKGLSGTRRFRRGSPAL